MFPVHRVAPPVRAGVALLALLALAAIDAQAFVPAGTNASDSRWQSTASGSTGQAGDPITLTWGFANDGTQTLEPDSQTSRVPSDLIASFDSQFGAGPGGGDLTQRPWFIFFEQSFDRLSDLMGVTFQYEPNDDGTNHGFLNGLIGVRADVRIAGISMDGSGGTLAYNYFPNGGGGDMALDTDDLSGFANSANNYRFLRNIVMHEMGHGLGLEHSSSNNANFLMEATINTSFDGPQHGWLGHLDRVAAAVGVGTAIGIGQRLDHGDCASDAIRTQCRPAMLVDLGIQGDRRALDHVEYVLLEIGQFFGVQNTFENIEAVAGIGIEDGGVEPSVVVDAKRTAVVHGQCAGRSGLAVGVHCRLIRTKIDFRSRLRLGFDRHCRSSCARNRLAQESKRLPFAVKCKPRTTLDQTRIEHLRDR